MTTPDAATLKSVFAASRRLSEWSVGAVFIGLIGEILVILSFTKDKPRSEIWLSCLCTLVIAAGVCGEYIFGRTAADAANQLQEISAKDVLALQRSANDSKALQQRVETELAKQQIRAVEAERSLLQLQESLKHRHLTDSQYTELVRVLKAGPKGGVLLTCPVDNAEACDFLREIGMALTEAGWVNQRDMPRVFETAVPGIEVSSRTEHPTPALLVLVNAFRAIGVVINNRSRMPKLDAQLDARILVGTNPHWSR